MSSKQRNAEKRRERLAALLTAPTKTALPAVVDSMVRAALDLADIPMNPDQRAIADEIYTLANRLEGTYDE